MADSVVYVIDDDAAIRDSLDFLLTSSGFAVRTYDTAMAFLSEFAEEKGRCLVTDIRMPGMSGLELVRELRRCGARLPVIALAGHGDFSLAVEAARAGVAGFIEKPFEGEALLAAVGAALDGEAVLNSRRAALFEQLSAPERRF
jgi:two-component system response regulator FixJ